MKNVKEWLNQEPPESEIRFINGLAYLPIDIVETLLDELGYWDTKNFTHHYFEFGGTLWISASLELNVSYVDGSSHGMSRVLVGTSTFSFPSLGNNTHYASSAKSFCIVNAASELGRRFGRFLNKSVIEENINVERPKLKPDAIVKKQFANAIKNKDTATIESLEKTYDFNA
jgi:hypothetical protein